MLSNVVKRYMPLLEKAIKYIMHVIANRIEYGRYADSSVGSANDYRLGETS